MSRKNGIFWGISHTFNQYLAHFQQKNFPKNFFWKVKKIVRLNCIHIVRKQKHLDFEKG